MKVVIEQYQRSLGILINKVKETQKNAIALNESSMVDHKPGYLEALRDVIDLLEEERTVVINSCKELLDRNLL